MTVRLDLGGLTDSHLSRIFRFFKLLPMIITKKKHRKIHLKNPTFSGKGITLKPTVFLTHVRVWGKAKHERSTGHALWVLLTCRSNQKPLLRFLSEILTQRPQKWLLTGSACLKDLTCAPRGSLAFGFALSPASLPYACSWERKPLGSRVRKNPKHQKHKWWIKKVWLTVVYQTWCMTKNTNDELRRVCSDSVVHLMYDQKHKWWIKKSLFWFCCLPDVGP